MPYILLVEDNPDHADMVSRVLISGGFMVRHVKRASKGLAMARQECPALILLDLELPDMSGEMAARVFRQQMGSKTPPIVAVTAHDDGEHRQSARNAGCQAFIAKPVEPQELLSAAKYFIEGNWDQSDLTLHKRPG